MPHSELIEQLHLDPLIPCDIAMLATFTLLTQLSTLVFAATVIGPVSDLHIVNKEIAPDGFKRE
jgi:hypothetical protein